MKVEIKLMRQAQEACKKSLFGLSVFGILAMFSGEARAVGELPPISPRHEEMQSRHLKRQVDAATGRANAMDRNHEHTTRMPAIPHQVKPQSQTEHSGGALRLQEAGRNTEDLLEKAENMGLSTPRRPEKPSSSSKMSGKTPRPHRLSGHH